MMNSLRTPNILQPFPKWVRRNCLLKCHLQKKFFGELDLRHLQDLAKKIAGVFHEETRPFFRSDHMSAPGHCVAISHEDSSGNHQSDHRCIDQGLHDFWLGSVNNIERIARLQFLEQEFDAPSASVQVRNSLRVEGIERKIRQIQTLLSGLRP